jgi:VIT1/CCC1 family predicted Fe2+/Mn2+ transporter
VTTPPTAAGGSPRPEELRESWFEEQQSAWLYRLLAAHEHDVTRSALFRTLADAADRQSEVWRALLVKRGGTVPVFAPPPRARIVGAFARLLGARAIRPMLAAMKIRGLSSFAARLPIAHTMPDSVEDVGARHKGIAGGNLRAAVFGVNDGLVSNLSLIMGVAGATAEPRFVLVSGIAGLLAGALSMAAGEYVSVRSQRELYESQIDLERKELEQYPDEEAEELALIYAARGMDLDEARRFTRAMMQDPAHALDALAREELGLDPANLGSAVGASVSSFLSFAVGASIPLIPFLLRVTAPTAWAIGASGVALFCVGATLSLFTGRAAWRGGARMLAIGAAAGAVTFALGHLFGTSFA